MPTQVKAPAVNYIRHIDILFEIVKNLGKGIWSVEFESYSTSQTSKTLSQF
jgi:hypothetical protein